MATRVSSFFPSIFCTISAFSLNGEYVVRSFVPNGVFNIGVPVDVYRCCTAIPHTTQQRYYNEAAVLDIPWKATLAQVGETVVSRFFAG